jgi:hypothetical protein
VRIAAVIALAGCHFHPHAASDAGDNDAIAADAPADAAPDAPPPAFCPPDPHLRLCFSFDQNPLPASLPEQGAATNPATLTNVTSTASPLGGAALLGATSSIVIAQDAAVSGILASEIWFRMDADAPANGARESLFDSNIIPPNISMFVYRNDPHHDVHCGIGSQSESWTTDAVMLATWHHAECICANGNLSFYLDGVDLGDRPGNCGTAGALVGDGFTIGANNNGAGRQVNERLIGAIDGIRLWDQPPSGGGDERTRSGVARPR